MADKNEQTRDQVKDAVKESKDTGSAPAPTHDENEENDPKVFTSDMLPGSSDPDRPAAGR